MRCVFGLMLGKLADWKATFSLCHNSPSAHKFQA